MGIDRDDMTLGDRIAGRLFNDGMHEVYVYLSEKYNRLYSVSISYTTIRLSPPPDTTEIQKIIYPRCTSYKYLRYYFDDEREVVVMIFGKSKERETVNVAKEKQNFKKDIEEILAGRGQSSLPPLKTDILQGLSNHKVK